MYREIEEKFIHLIKDTNKALLVYGARQIGKTHSIRHVLEENGMPYFEINFILRSDIRKDLERIDDVNEFIDKIKTLSPIPLEEGSVIFFDEIQSYPDILTKIKGLVDDGRFKYVLSGSMLGVELKGLTSMPVGYVNMVKMYPMNLHEFSLALGIKEETYGYLEKCLMNKAPVDEIIHKSLMNAFDYYVAVGGMPDAVNAFVKSKNLLAIRESQEAIINQYKADFTKYEADDRKLKIISIYDNIPSQMNKQSTKFVFSYLNKELKFDRYENSFLWLKDAGVALPVYIANQVEIPLEISKDKNTFKLFYSDVGLLEPYFSVSIGESLMSGNDSSLMNKGSLYESVIAQELFSHGLTPYYFKNVKIGEIDFLAEIDDEIYAIEVKSGSDYKKHKALNNLAASNPKNPIKYIVLSKYNLEVEGDILYLPIYMASFLKSEEASSKEIMLDIDPSLLA